MPCAPASSASVAARSTLGIPSSRVLRSSATLLTLTDSAVLRCAGMPVVRSGFMEPDFAVCATLFSERLHVAHHLARAQGRVAELMLDPCAQRRSQLGQRGSTRLLQGREAAVLQGGLYADQRCAVDLAL